MKCRTPAWYFILFLLVVPISAQAQTRLFQPGDSGVTTTLDFLLVKKNYYGDTFGILRGSYTYHGSWDLGVEYGTTVFHNDSNGLVFFGNYAVINPAPGDKWGLEVRVQYSNQVSQSHLPPVLGFFIPAYDRVRFQNLQPGLTSALDSTRNNWSGGYLSGTPYFWSEFRLATCPTGQPLNDYLGFGPGAGYVGPLPEVIHLINFFDSRLYRAGLADIYFTQSTFHGPSAEPELRPALLIITGQKGD